MSGAVKIIRVLIVDDEPIAREGIRMHLEGEPGMTIIGECANGLEAVAVLQEASPDLLFLDVQMPGLDGFEVLEAVGVEAMPTVIFVTAYDRYALRAFEVHALDYILKPFDGERFQKALQRARAHIERASSTDVNTRLLALLEDLKAGHKHLDISGQKYLERLVIKTAGRIFFMSTHEIDWIEAADNYVKLHTGREAHLLRETMNGLEGRLDPHKFLRIRRNTMVNIERIRELRTHLSGEYAVILRNGTELVSSRRYRKKLSAMLGE
jgi:two-component system LytT family response regulator